MTLFEINASEMTLSDKVFITGTHAYGPLSENSDFDIVMLHEDALILKQLLSFLDIRYKDNIENDPNYLGYSFKFNQHDKVQVVVAENDKEFNAWKFATNKMKKIKPVEDKEKRKIKFREFYNDYIDNL